MNQLYCLKEPAEYFIFAPDVPALLYYSHIPTAILSLIIGIFVFSKGKSSASFSLFGLAVAFSLWSLFDLILWAQPDSRMIMFFWSIVILAEVFIYFFGFYLAYVFVNKKDAPVQIKLLLFLLLLPVVLFLPTQYNLAGFIREECIASEGVLSIYYVYAVEVLLAFLTAIFSVLAYRATRDLFFKKQILLFGSGIILFFLTFFFGNAISSFVQTDAGWQIANYGLFGVVFFIATLAYLIVKYKTFDVKLLGTQALVLALASLIGSQLFFVKTTINYFLTSITLMLVLGFGLVLIRSVKGEVRRKEELQEMATKLAMTNEELRKLDNTKSEFISIASHQLRTPLTAIKGFLSLVLEGSYGRVSPEVEDVLNKVYSANSHLVELVENLLNISRIESGRIQYQFAPSDIVAMVRELEDSFSVIAKGRGLGLSVAYPERPIPLFLMDAQKVREVVSNMIDNAIKYTPNGKIEVHIENDDASVRISVSDTGVGISPDDLPVLFQKFRRGKESGKVNVSGTGLGLYVGRSFAEAHGGRLSVASEGVGKGSTFTLELPVRTEAEVKKGESERE